MKPTKYQNNQTSIYFLIIILPFILLYWMVPFATDLTLGADYQIFSINEQIELLFSVKTGSFPLYVPGYKFGHSASALTLSQIYHPISHIASILPGYWDGKANEWITFLRLLSLGLVHLLIFAFLRKIRLNTLFSFLISLITVYNLRMLEAFRYGASFEAYTGTLLLCTLIGWHFLSPSRWLLPLSIVAGTYLLVCSGHPPMMFYGLLGSAVFTLVTPHFLAVMLPDIEVDFKTACRFWVKVGGYIFLGIVLSTAYILPFYVEFVSTNIEYRSIAKEIGAYIGQDTFAGILSIFFMPLISDVLCTFGGSSLIIIPLLLPLLLCFRVKVPPAVWVVWGILLLALVYILGPQTPVYRWAAEYLPLVSSTGGVGRIAMIVPPLMMLLMAWVITAEPFSVRSIMLTPYTFLGLIALILIPVFVLNVFLLKPELGNFTPHFIRNIPLLIEVSVVLLSMVSLAALVLYGMYPQSARIFGVFLCLMIILHIGTVLKYGIFIEVKESKPTFEQLKIQKKKSLDFNFHQNPSMFHSVVLNHLERSFMEPYLGKIFTEAIPVDSQEDAYEKMERARYPNQIFIEGYETENTAAAKDMNEGRLELTYSSFNRLQFQAVSGEDAFFGLSYPYTGHWNAWVNGKKARVYRANGIAHAVEIPAGESLIEFRYWSDASFMAMFISYTAFALIGLFVCFRGLNGLPRILGIVAVLIISAGGFMLWYNSLYSGDDLETEYAWTYTPLLKTPNIAYGKKTLSYYPHDSSMLRFHSGYAIDGNTEPGSGFTLKFPDEALVIDLNHIREIKTIVLYGTFKTIPEISLSQDNKQWQSLNDIISGDNKNVCLRIIFKNLRSARFIKVQAIDSAVGIDELEAYGPEPI